MKNKLYIISNEKIFQKEGIFFCDNLDLKTTPEGLSKFFDVKLLARKTKIARSHKINIGLIQIYSNLFQYVKNVIKCKKDSNAKYLIISLSPYTFIACILLRFLGKKPYLYLRSNGYDEYKIILGFFGYIVYHFMFVVASKTANLISCTEYILMKKKGHIVSPSQLTQAWYEKKIIPKVFENKLLYVGRVKKEKGIFSLIKILKGHPEIKLTIVGAGIKTKKISNENIKLMNIVRDQKELINLYDDNDLMILPSYTEGYPMVVLESLSRLRPIIIFGEIKHIIGDRKGIFIAERNYNSLKKTINFIKENYSKIQEDIKKNRLPTNDEFISQIEKILSNNL